MLGTGGVSVRTYPPTREHGPAHVHVIRGRGEVVIALGEPDEGVSVREVYAMRRADVHAAVALVEEHAELLRRKWEEYHGWTA